MTLQPPPNCPCFNRSKEGDLYFYYPNIKNTIHCLRVDTSKETKPIIAALAVEFWERERIRLRKWCVFKGVYAYIKSECREECQAACKMQEAMNQIAAWREWGRANPAI